MNKDIPKSLQDNPSERKEMLIRAYTWLRHLTEDERMTVMGRFCRFCGTPLNDGESCHCTNDE